MLGSVAEMLIAQYSIAQWVLVFFIFSFVGWCWEVSLYLVRERRFVNRGFLSGPILPIYGFGVVCILLCCIPFEENTLLVALVGTVAASLLEYATGAAMEALFHVRYWDYSKYPLNFRGYICLYSAMVWALFSAILVRFVQPFLRPWIVRVPDGAAMACAATLSVFALCDTVRAVRRALDLRKLLEEMERYAQEVEALRGNLRGINERMNGMIRAFAEQVDERRESLGVDMKRLTAAQDHAREALGRMGQSIVQDAGERFVQMQKVLAEVAAYLPDAKVLREEIEEARGRYEHQFELLHRARVSGLSHAKKMLRRNPGAVSDRYARWLEEIRKEK